MPQRKPFRIEHLHRSESAARQRGVAADPTLELHSALRHREMIGEIRAVRALIEGRAQEAQRAIENFQAQLREFQKLKTELDLIQNAIVQTKQELATIHVSGFNGAQIARVANELDAVVEGTEQATQAILSAVEDIDGHADKLAGALQDRAEQGSARAIQAQVVQIFEACNFQDLTGQRITKVVAALKFIEDRIRRMMEIWGGIEAFEEFTPTALAHSAGDDEFLHGPKLDGDTGHASQDDIDALFD